MKLNRHHVVAAMLAAAVLPVRLLKADQTKADNTSNLDLGASWVSGTAPLPGDMAIWSGTYNTAGGLSDTFTASTPVSWEGIRIGTVAGTAAGLISIGGTGAAITGSQLTLGIGGIDMSTANENLVINTRMTTISQNQTWNISSGHNLRLASTGTGAANAIMNGSGNILITGGGVVDLNEGGSTGFADANSFATFTGTWTINSGATLRAIRNGATAFGNNTSAGAITLAGGTLADGGISGDSGSWTWNTNITLASGTSSAIDEQIPSTIAGGRYLKLNGNFTGSATANLVFKDTDATTTFSNSNYGYILTGTNTMSAGSTITIGGPVENGIAGRLTYVRVGGNDGATGTDLTTTAGPGGSLGAAAVVDNGILTFSYNNANTVGNSISGTGSVNIGGSASAANTAIGGANTQILTLTGTNTYTGLTSVAGGSTLILATPGTFANAYTGGLTIGYSGTNGTVGTANISSGTNLTGFGAINVNAGTLNVVGNLSSTATLLLGANGGTGALNITAGTVNLKGISLNSTTSSTANLTVSGGVLNIGSAGISALTAGNTNLNLGPATLGATANWSSNQNFNLTDGTTGTTLNTLDAVDGVTPRTITLSGTLSGSGLLNVTGTGKLYFNGSDNSNGNVTVAGGATLGGSGSFSGATTIATGGSLEAGQLGVGSITFNSGLTFNGSGNVNIGTLAGYGSTPAIIDNSTLTANGSANSVTINIANIVAASVGTPYPLFSYQGGSIGGTGFSAFKLAPLPSRAVGTLSNTGSEIALTINSFAYLIWNGASNPTNGWDTTTPNWNLSSGGSTTYIDSPSPDAVVFDDTASVTTVNLNTIVHPNAVTFNNNTSNYTIQGTGGISGSTGLMMTGTGIVNLNTSNSFTGPVSINAGITRLQNSTALGASVGVTVASGATLQLQGGIITGSIPLSINGTGANGQNGVLVNSAGTNTYAGPITLAGNSTISSDSGNLTLSSATPIVGSGNSLTLTGAGNGTITSPIGIGSGSVIVNGTGVWTFSGTNTYTGLTSVVSGTLAAVNSLAIPAGSTISLGTSSSGSANIALNISGGVTVSSPINVTNPGTATISINVNGAITSTLAGSITLNQSLIINNTNTAELPSAFTGGTLPIGSMNLSSSISGNGGLTFTGGGVTLLLNGINTYSGQTVVTGNTLVEYFSSNSTDPNTLLNISAGSRVVFSNSAGKFGGLTGSGLFTASTQSTNYETIGSLNDAADNFMGVIAGPLYLTKTGSGMQILSGSSTYNDATIVSSGTLQAGVATVPGVSGAFGVNTNTTVSGGTLDLNSFNTSIGSLSDGGSNSGVVTLGSATLTISGSSNASFGGTISGSGGLVIKTSATQTLSGYNTYLGPTNVSTGTLVITATGALPTGNAVSVNTGAMLVLDSQTTASSLNLLNINGNAVIHNGNLQTLSTAAQLAFNAGWNNPTGIASTAAAGNTTHLTALGIIQNDNGMGTGTPLYTSFEGQSVSDSDVLVKYTYYGDTDLNGKVDGSDYSRIDNAYLNNQNSNNPQLTGWYNGDFNYDGVVDGSDYTLIDNAYNSQGTQISARLAAPTAQLAGTSPVPEPVTFSLLNIGAIGLLSRRCRRR